MSDDEINVPADQPDPAYLDDGPPDSPDDVQEPAQAGELDPESEPPAGIEPTEEN